MPNGCGAYTFAFNNRVMRLALFTTVFNEKVLLIWLGDRNQTDSDSKQRVGSCIGLTSLYSVLGLRERLNLTVLVSENHIMNRLRTADCYYNIDNTDPLGFDCNIDECEFR